MTAPVLTRPASARFDLGGATADYLKAVTEQWLLPTPAANPAILEMFRDRDRQPQRDMVPWAGEFAGKYLTSGVQILRLTRDADLRRQLAGFVVELTLLQDDDGYLGPWSRDHRLTGKAPNCRGNSRSEGDHRRPRRCPALCGADHVSARARRRATGRQNPNMWSNENAPSWPSSP